LLFSVNSLLLSVKVRIRCANAPNFKNRPSLSLSLSRM
jgi:hypothetical protein